MINLVLASMRFNYTFVDSDNFYDSVDKGIGAIECSGTASGSRFS
jgi:hypothetical protein